MVEEKSSDNSGPGGPVPSPSLDFNDNEDIPTELSDSSETHDEGTGTQRASETERNIEVTLCVSGEAAFHEDLNGRLHINEVFKFSVDKLYDILFTQSQFMSDFNVQRRISGELTSDPWAVGPLSLLWLTRSLCCAALDVVYQPWKKEDAGNQTREIMYTISLTNPLAPKTSTASEIQVDSRLPQKPPSNFLNNPNPNNPFLIQTLYKVSQESECYIVDAEVITHDVPYHDYFYALNHYILTRVAKNKCRLR